MPTTSVTGVPYQTPLSNNRITILLVEDGDEGFGADFRNADFVLTRSGTVLKSRTGGPPPVSVIGAAKKTKQRRRSIDD